MGQELAKLEGRVERLGTEGPDDVDFPKNHNKEVVGELVEESDGGEEIFDVIIGTFSLVLGNPVVKG